MDIQKAYPGIPDRALLEEHQQRVYDELVEARTFAGIPIGPERDVARAAVKVAAATRLGALAIFIATNPIYRKIDEAERVRLLRQHGYMQQFVEADDDSGLASYIDVLVDRLLAF